MDFDEAVERTGWNEQSQIEILLEYIANQQSDDAFRDYLAQRVAEEEVG
jgi:hypothetical protein